MRAHEVLEQEWAKFNGVNPAGMVACSSGTAALHLALEALRLPTGSQVIVPDFSMVACARAVSMAGLKPLFVDCGADLNMDWRIVTTSKPKCAAVMCVHIYGRRVDMDQVHKDLTWDHGMGNVKQPVIEDLAEAHGIGPHPHTSAACWSFYRNKVVGGEEGGAVWFRDPAHADLARQFRCLGFTDAHDYTHVPRGHNYRLADSLAKLVLSSLARYSTEIDRRHDLEQMYIAATPDKWMQPRRDVPWVYDVRIPGMSPNAQTRIIGMLRGAGIEARHAFKPLSRQPEYFSREWPSKENMADNAAREVITLPLTQDVTQDRVTVAMGMIRRHCP